MTGYDPSGEPWYDDDGLSGPPKEAPDCGTCTDRGWVQPWGGIRRWVYAAWDLNPPGTDPAWRRPRGGQWPCPDCNPTQLDVIVNRMRDLRRLPGRWLRRCLRPAGALEEPPF